MIKARRSNDGNGAVYNNATFTEPYSCLVLTRIIQSLYYASAGRYINAWMQSLIRIRQTGNCTSCGDIYYFFYYQIFIFFLHFSYLLFIVFYLLPIPHENWKIPYANVKIWTWNVKSNVGKKVTGKKVTEKKSWMKSHRKKSHKKKSQEKKSHI